jgi:phage/plasmid-associated DNA primase
VLAFNNLPSLKHRDKTIEGRLVILPFRESFLGREDRVLNETLKAEEIGIFIRAFQGLKRLQAR